jgi:hypothetical protein
MAVSFTASAKGVPSRLQSLLDYTRASQPCVETGAKCAGELRYDASLMMRIMRRGWAFLFLTVALALIAAFLPDLAGAGWHLINGPSVRYRDWRIPVPSGWFALHQGEGVTMERMLSFALWQPAPTAVFLPIHVTPAFVFDREIWEQEQIAIQAQRGYRFDRGQAVVVASNPGYCWEFSSSRDPRRLWITCIVPAERISVDFSGAPRFVPTFYSILPGITHAVRSN